jgi:hypothetical protein
MHSTLPFLLQEVSCVGSTTPSKKVQPYRLDLAESYIDRQQWTRALEQCEGLLNGNKRQYFTDPHVWAYRAYALLWLGKKTDAEWSIAQAIDLSMQPDISNNLRTRYLDHLLKYTAHRDDSNGFNAAVARLDRVYYSTYGSGRLVALTAQLHYRAAMRLHTRGNRNLRLVGVVISCRRAESIWTERAETVPSAERVQNLSIWLMALANQTRGWDEFEIVEVLEKIQRLDASMAAQLRKKLRWRKLLGFTIYQ